MTKNLDDYRPNQEVFLGVKRQLVNSGIDPDSISDAWVEATIAAMAKWIKTTEQGASTLMSLLNFEAVSGSEDKDYTFYPDEGPREENISPANIKFFRGVMVNNLPVASDQLDIREKEQDSCEDCGIMGHCTLTVLDPYKGNQIRLCNHCMINWDHFQVSDQGDQELCNRCPQTNCSNNPSKSVVTRRHRA